MRTTDDNKARGGMTPQQFDEYQKTPKNQRDGLLRRWNLHPDQKKKKGGRKW